MQPTWNDGIVEYWSHGFSGCELTTGLMKISYFNDVYLSENLSRFVPRFVAILKQLFAGIQIEKTKPFAHHL
jgi:hypothetical protein